METAGDAKTPRVGGRAGDVRRAEAPLPVNDARAHRAREDRALRPPPGAPPPAPSPPGPAQAEGLLGTQLTRPGAQALRASVSEVEACVLLVTEEKTATAAAPRRPTQRAPPQAQLPAGRGAEGLPGSERPAAGPLPLSRRREHRAAPGAAPTSSERPNMHQPITSSAEAAPAAAAIFASGPSGLRRRARGRGGERGDCEGRGARAP